MFSLMDIYLIGYDLCSYRMKNHGTGCSLAVTFPRFRVSIMHPDDGKQEEVIHKNIRVISRTASQT